MISSHATDLGGFIGIQNGHERTVERSYASGHVIGDGGNLTQGGFTGRQAGGTNVKTIDSLAFGHIATWGERTGAFLGSNQDIAGTTVLGVSYWDHAGNPGRCIGRNENLTDEATCNDAEDPDFYKDLTHFTSLTSVYANWDFDSVWKFPTTVGLPILRWMYEP